MRYNLEAAARSLILVSLLVPGMAFAAAVKPTGEFVPNEVIVKFKTGTPASAVAAAHQAADVDEDKDDKLAEVKSGTIKRFRSRSKSTEALIRALEHNPNIVYVEPNYIVRPDATPNDTNYSDLWALRNGGQPDGYGNPRVQGIDINAEAAWNVTTGSADIVVAIVDSGVDYTHPDLAANIWSNPGGVGNPNCAAGTHGYDAQTKSCDPKPDDDFHGTHVAGTIGAVGNNALGVTGVNWTTTIMPLKSMDYGFGTIADAIAAIDFAVQAKIDGVNVRVINSSWSGEDFSKALLDQILETNEHDILFVVSAGNENANNDTWKHYPTSFNTSNMISVTATTPYDGLLSYSSYGPTTVHLGAPGSGIVSTWNSGGYATLNGTSMAAAHVAGVAALLLSKSPNLTAAEVKQAILAGVDPLPSLVGRTLTGGRLNAAKVLGVPSGPDFTIAANPSALKVLRGESANVELTITPSGGFSAPVQLSATGLPYGVTASFDPNPATTSSTLTLSVDTKAYQLNGTYPVMIGAGSSQAGNSMQLPFTIVTAPPVPACPSFTRWYTPGWYGEPTGIALGDFDRNGTTDIASVSASSATTLILLGRAGGGFNIGSNIVGGNTPIAVTTADFDRDGKLDLAIANAGASHISVHLGFGNGSFAPATQFQSGSNPFALATGDFDADGSVDLAVANNGSSSISILRGLGDGSFASPTSYGVGSGPYWIEAGDLNRDGRTDLAVVASNANQVVVLLGNVDGSFQPGVGYPAGTKPTSVVLGDVNGDGSVDLVATGYVSNNVSVLIGSGDGTFDPAVSYAVGNAPASVAIVDLDGDGHVDLAVSNEDDDTVSFLFGSGDGSFGSAMTWTAGSSPTQIVATDVDRDGFADLVVVTTTSTALSILRNSGSCRLSCGLLDSTGPFVTGSEPNSLAIGDFNADGTNDVLTANHGSNDISLALGTGNGAIQSPVSYDAGTGPRAVHVADLDGNGSLDLTVANEGSDDVSVLLGNADGSFEPAVSYATGNAPGAVIAVDVNRDGKLDIAAANAESDDVSILIGTGSGNFGPASSIASGDSPGSLVAADFDRDGNVDLAVANSGSNNVTALRGNGDGTFQSGVEFATGSTPVALVAADFDRDGITDLATADGGSNTVSLLRGTGTGSFDQVAFAAGSAPSGLVAVDINHDGVVDLAVTNSGSNDLTLLFGLGDGGFASPTSYSAGTTPRSIAAADLDGDRKTDLAVANETTGDISIFLNTCPVPDLVVSKTHTGSFAQGDTDRVFSITVTNTGEAQSTGLVSVTDSIPVGLIASTLSGNGWNCALGTLTCTRYDALAAGASYPTITLTVDVANNAPAIVTNVATVAGGGEFNVLNNSASDSATIAQVPDLTIEKTHAGSFAQGSTDRTYTITIRNPGGMPTSGTVTVTDILPAGLTATSINGTGWNCNLAGLTCSRSDALAARSTFPAIELTVDVAANAPARITNTATVSGGGEVGTSNNTASDPTIVWNSQTCPTFDAGVDYGVAGDSSSIVSGDVNGDDIVDIVSGSSSTGLSVLLGTGGGAFAPAVTYFPSYGLRQVALADLNNDGAPDLVAIHADNQSNASVLLGLGDGTFAQPRQHPLPNRPIHMALGDYTGDGKVDVAVTLESTNQLSILVGNGDGTLQSHVAHPDVANPSDVVDGDFDEDGKLDLAVLSYTSSAVALLRGNGDGSFQAPVLHPVDNAPVALAVGDFDENGNADLVVTHSYEESVSILLGNGDATFAPAFSVASAYTHSPSLAVEDLNGDGRQDVVIGTSSGLTTLPGNGNGTFKAAATQYLGSSPFTFAVSDFNGDGKADLALPRNSAVRVLLGDCPDLVVAKSHTGDFLPGQTYAEYSLVVTNVGAAATAGTVSVTDTLPAGLTATYMYGYGWTCTLAAVSCTLNGSLLPGDSADEITLYVSVSDSAPASVTNVANVSGGGERNLANNSASDPTTILQGADVTIAKSHTQAFARGGTGAIYTISVSNVGSDPTTGMITVVDTLPLGLTATSMQGPGWNCNLGTLSCTRSDALAASGSYPAITLAVNVAQNCPSFVINVATVSGGGDTVVTNNTSSDPTVVLHATSAFGAQRTSTSSVSISWDPVFGAGDYLLYMATGGGDFTAVYSTPYTSYTTSGLTPNTVYRYRVQARSGQTLGPMSPIDTAITMAFTDDPIVAGSTPVKAVHFYELRTGVSLMRAAAGLPPATFTDPVLVGVPVKAVHYFELWERLHEARVALGAMLFSYSDYPMTPGKPITAQQIQELRFVLK